jgi:hypothetical protein
MATCHNSTASLPDLWDTYQGRAPDEYKNATRFFEKTQLTRGLRTLLDVVERRLQGKGGDPVIQIQTPFGGEKTHALVAMYHKAKEWNAKTVVIVGTAMSKKDTIWGMIEKQLAGNVSKLSGEVSPGREDLRAVLAFALNQNIVFPGNPPTLTPLLGSNRPQPSPHSSIRSPSVGRVPPSYLAREGPYAGFGVFRLI